MKTQEHTPVETQDHISEKTPDGTSESVQENASSSFSIYRPLFHLLSDQLKFTGVVMENPHHITIPQRLVCLLGENGAGKTTLATIVERGRNFMTNRIITELPHWPRIRSISFTDIHSLTGFKVEYYQQRFESTMNDEVPTVAQLLGEKVNTELYKGMSRSFTLSDVLDKKVNYLSSGELRKLLIINTLFELPQVLILDNPFIGLDSASKIVVEKALEEIVKRGVNVILLLADSLDIPSIATAVIPIRDMTIGKVMGKFQDEDIESFRDRALRAASSLGASGDLGQINLKDQEGHENREGQEDKEIQVSQEDQENPQGHQNNKDKDEEESLLISKIIDSDKTYGESTSASKDGDVVCAKEIVRLTDCKMCYGKRVLLEHVNWNIRQGECWALSGPNGSGKSTLLSLINADNPQAYSNDIVLFGRRRGTGESIWDIKTRIGFVSAELHLNFRGWNDSLNTVIAQGLRTALNRFVPLSEHEKNRIDLWLEYFNLSHLRDVPFHNLSSGQQRLSLVIRAMINQPQLIVLDEPMHGLDAPSKRKVNKVIERFSKLGTSIIYVTHNPEELPGCVTHHKQLSKI